MSRIESLRKLAKICLEKIEQKEGRSVSHDEIESIEIVDETEVTDIITFDTLVEMEFEYALKRFNNKVGVDSEL